MTDIENVKHKPGKDVTHADAQAVLNALAADNNSGAQVSGEVADDLDPTGQIMVNATITFAHHEEPRVLSGSFSIGGLVGRVEDGVHPQVIENREARAAAEAKRYRVLIEGEVKAGEVVSDTRGNRYSVESAEHKQSEKIVMAPAGGGGTHRAQRRRQQRGTPQWVEQTYTVALLAPADGEGENPAAHIEVSKHDEINSKHVRNSDGTPPLRGTKLQIKYASDIRDAYRAQLPTADALYTITDAKVWIEQYKDALR